MTARVPAPDLEIVPLSTALGAEIRGVDLARPLDEATFEKIHTAWLEPNQGAIKRTAASSTVIVPAPARATTRIRCNMLCSVQRSRAGRSLSHCGLREARAAGSWSSYLPLSSPPPTVGRW